MFLGMGGIIAGAFVVVALYYLTRMIKEKKYTCKTDGRMIYLVIKNIF